MTGKGNGEKQEVPAEFFLYLLLHTVLYQKKLIQKKSSLDYKHPQMQQRLIILVIFTVSVYLPLKKITEAANEYASGNLKHRLQVAGVFFVS